MKTDVLIVGAGPTGLMAAALLCRSGIKCRVIDKGSDQVRESRALGIQARTMELFQNLGIVDNFLSRGKPIKGMKAYLNGEEKFAIDFSDMARKDTPYPFVFILSQAETEKILIDDLKSFSMEVERQTTLLEFTQTRYDIEAIIQTANGKKEFVKAKYLIGCDGARSIVRDQLKLKFEGGSYPSQFIMSDAKVDWAFDHDHLRAFLNPGSIGIFFPLNGKESSRVLTVMEVDAEPLTQTTTSYPASLLEIEKNFAEASHQKIKLSDPTWVTKYHVHHRCVNKLQVGRAFVAGDAAHVHSPAGAQGMNTGLQDAANLCWKIARVIKGYADPKILETYHKERWPVAQKLLKFTDRFFSVATSRNKYLIKVRDMLFPFMTKVLMNQTSGRKFIFGFISQLGIHYHPNSYIHNGAGNRVPNFELEDGTKVFDLLTGYQFHLIVFGEEAVKQKFPETNVHHLKNSTFKTKGLMLVRPDGYTAFESTDVSEKSLQIIRSILQFNENGRIYAASSHEFGK
jgi:2-polyprenyl-6-methoxyphenol hydroxylase-like FAD-dependent oxidoreductase